MTIIVTFPKLLEWRNEEQLRVGFSHIVFDDEYLHNSVLVTRHSRSQLGVGGQGAEPLHVFGVLICVAGSAEVPFTLTLFRCKV